MLKKLRMFFCGMALFFALSGGQAAAFPEILTPQQLTPGMQGVAKTVVQGSKIEDFSVEIIGVMGDEAGADSKIVARASGDVIDQTDGVLQGMSGSPVYVDGKLIGAISAGWKEIDRRTCLITPITQMVDLWQLPDERNKGRIAQVDLKKEAPEKKEKAVDMPVLADAAQPRAESLPDESLASPLMVTGFSEAGLSMLRERLRPFALTPYASGASSAGRAPIQLEAGSSVGVQIVRGDFNMSAIGTVTAVKDGRVLAFGHPFLRKGNVNYFMTDAEIITTASGSNAGFKVGLTGNVVGRINQDRSAGVAGVIGKYPSVVPMQVFVEDAQTQQKHQYAVQIAYDESLLSALVPSIAYNAIDTSIDRLGVGTAEISFEIMTNSVQGGTLKRKNMFYNVQDVGQIAVGELFQAMNLLCANAQEEADIVGVKVWVKINEARQTASIVEVVPEQTEAAPGDTVQLKIKLKPYRRAQEEIVVAYQVPKHQTPGKIDLEVRGGGVIPPIVLLLQQQGLELAGTEDKMVPLPLKLKQLMEADCNNELIVAPAPALPEDASNRKEKRSNSKDAALMPEKPVKQSTNYIIDNAMPVSITIKK